ncbi:MAG TPA: class I SAM-dependent methyltransferase [Methylibium sp.]|uniref:class I SAM-dependent methyltransferase n=1 Tax=Methylibium sp. TaxID=2067992 RepID=UPI002DB78A1F|nr:class I SAM-dependent methyltransferase [Methylibium sp.]HEU4459393.1 class I SAM-dependent methyltransferase [Methylibium sp.]
MSAHAGLAPSPWVLRWARGFGAPHTALDLACGHGRHLRWLAARGVRVTGIDRDADAMAALRGSGAELLVADLEAGPWPLAGRRFDLVVVTNYLWRPLLPAIVEALADGGLLVYETFALGNASVGKPSNPDFLLRPGELLDALRPALRVIGYEDGFLGAPERFVQRIAAAREPGSSPASGAVPPRYPL